MPTLPNKCILVIDISCSKSKNTPSPMYKSLMFFSLLALPPQIPSTLAMQNPQSNDSPASLSSRSSSSKGSSATRANSAALGPRPRPAFRPRLRPRCAFAGGGPAEPKSAASKPATKASMSPGQATGPSATPSAPSLDDLEPFNCFPYQRMMLTETALYLADDFAGVRALDLDPHPRI